MYGWRGAKDVDGRHYEALEDATGYGSVDGLCGVNCRHGFGPYRAGAPRAYDPDPRHPSGLPGDEVYRLEQGQRRRERGIREAKRDLAGAQMVAGRDGSLANMAEVERAKARLAARQKGMRDFIAEANSKGKAPVLHRNPRHEWAGDMPKVRKTDASRRTMGEFLDGEAARRALKARGVSKSAAQKAMSEVLEEQGVDSRNWKYLSRANQRNIFKMAVEKISGGRLASLDDLAKLEKPDNIPHALKGTNPLYATSSRYQDNCRRCIAAYELRRRGYDAEALPSPILRDIICDKLGFMDEGGWPSMWADARPIEMAGTTGREIRKCIEHEMRTYGEGARAVVRVQWKGADYGYVFIAEQRGDETWFVDPQTNDIAYEGWETAIDT